LSARSKRRKSGVASAAVHAARTSAGQSGQQT
jgi:hypothetical protein